MEMATATAPMATATAAMPVATATPMTVGATVVPGGASTCALPVAIASALPVGVLQSMPAAVAAHPYASQIYIGMVLPEMNAPVPMGMDIDGDLDLLRKLLCETQPGEWHAPAVPTPCCCVCITSDFTVHPKSNKQYALTGTGTATCFYVLPSPCLSSTTTGAIAEDGTSYEQSMTSCMGVDSFQATLTSVDKDALSVTYALASTGLSGPVGGVQTIDTKAGTNVISYTSGSWAGMVIRHEKVRK